MKRALAFIASVVALTAATPRSAFAFASIIVQSSDPPGQGFHDPTPAAPVGGNPGTTLGEQRMNAIQHAADLWAEALDSEVPILIDATFANLGCSPGGVVLATASASRFEQGIDAPGADPDLIYPEALADRLMGSDLNPGVPDIVATFNAGVDSGCFGGSRWYYGIDGNHGDDQDIVLVALHELGHGLGVQGTIDPSTGEALGGFLGAYDAQLRDITTDERWSDMTDAERMASYTNVRGVVWEGARANAAAASVLASGRPSVEVAPAVAGFSGIASDASFSGPLNQSIGGQLFVDPSGCPQDLSSPALLGKIVLLRDGCAHSSWATALEGSGAVGLLLSWPDNGWESPPASVDEVDPAPTTLPALAISPTDADRLESAAQSGAISITLSLLAGLRGADSEGRVFLNATRPANEASSISHWDELTRPNLLMEPLQKPDEPHALDITPAMLEDMGWARFCGNGAVDQNEECDDGPDNDDQEPDACRSNCMNAGCGDGVLDDGEACDDGASNSNTRANACRLDCEEAACGDGVVDRDEPCDEGIRNNDTLPDACRTDCSEPSCGDGVRDSDEGCDEGPRNSDTAPDACRTSCMLARCGDGVIDEGEGCDDGEQNDDDAPDGCRSGCKLAYCGDGVKDQGEACDDGAQNSDTAVDGCRSDCTAARCGDGVVDEGERCDEGGPDCDDSCQASGDAGADAKAPDAGTKQTGDDDPKGMGSSTEDGGCACRLAVGSTAPTLRGGASMPTSWLLCAVGCAWLRIRRRRRHNS